MKRYLGLIVFTLMLSFGAVGCEECDDCDGTLDFCNLPTVSKTVVG